MATVITAAQRSQARWHERRRVPARPCAPLTFSDPPGWRLVAEPERPRLSHDLVPIGGPPQIAIAARRLPLPRTVAGNRPGFALALAARLGTTKTAPRSTAAAEPRDLVAEMETLP